MSENTAENGLLPCCRGEGECQAPPDIGPCDPLPITEKDRMRGTGGNRFIGPDATRGDLLASINDQLGDLQEWADETGRLLDLAEVTISTKRIPSGNISVSVTADLAPDLTRVTSPAFCLCGYVDDLGDGTCGNCGLRIMTEDDEARPIPPAPSKGGPDA